MRGRRLFLRGCACCRRHAQGRGDPDRPDPDRGEWYRDDGDQSGERRDPQGLALPPDRDEGRAEPRRHEQHGQPRGDQCEHSEEEREKRE